MVVVTLPPDFPTTSWKEVLWLSVPVLRGMPFSYDIKPKKAISWFMVEHATFSNTESVFTNFVRGLTYVASGEYEQAIEEFDKAINLEP